MNLGKGVGSWLTPRPGAEHVGEARGYQHCSDPSLLPCLASPGPQPHTPPVTTHPVLYHLCSGPQPGLSSLCCPPEDLRAHPTGAFGSPLTWADPGVPVGSFAALWRHHPRRAGMTVQGPCQHCQAGASVPEVGTGSPGFAATWLWGCGREPGPSRSQFTMQPRGEAEWLLGRVLGGLPCSGTQERGSRHELSVSTAWQSWMGGMDPEAPSPGQTLPSRASPPLPHWQATASSQF